MLVCFVDLIFLVGCLCLSCYCLLRFVAGCVVVCCVLCCRAVWFVLSGLLIVNSVAIVVRICVMCLFIVVSVLLVRWLCGAA